VVAFLREHHDSLARICRRCRVARLELFGSAARGESFDAGRSDLDFLVEFEPLAPGEMFDAFFDLREALEREFGRKIDLLLARSLQNPYLLESINRNRVTLYGA